MEDKALCFRFLYLFHLTSMKNGFVANVFVLFRSSPVLSLGLHRPLFDTETTNVMAFISLVYGSLRLDCGERIFAFGAWTLLGAFAAACFVVAC